MTQQAILERLKGFPAFSKWKPFDLEELANRLAVQEKRAGAVIFTPDSSADDAYIVNKGRVRQSVTDAAGNEWWYRTLSPGEVFGLMTVLRGGTRHSAATAETDCELYRLSARDLAWALNKHPELWDALQRPEVATRLRAIPLFRTLSDRQIERLEEDTRVHEFAAGQPIQLGDGASGPDSPEGDLWLIDWGQVEIVEQGRVLFDRSSRLSAVPDSGAGDPGSLPLLTAGNWLATGRIKVPDLRTAQGKAKTKVRLLRIPALQVEQLARGFPDVAEQLSQRFDIQETLTTDLATYGIFDNLKPEHWRSLAGYAGWEHVPRGLAVTRQGERSDALYLLVDGQAVVRATDAEGRDRPSHVIGVHESYGLSALLTLERADASVRSVRGASRSGHPLDGSEWLVLHRQDLLYMIEVERSLWSRTKLQAALTAGPERQRHKYLEEGETEYFYDRRHWIVLVPRMAFVVVALIIALVLALVGLSPSDGNWAGVAVAFAMLFALAAAVAVPLILWNYLDDHYAITDRRVLNRERIYVFRDNQKEAPLETVQDVTIQRDFLGNLFGYGDLSLQTAAEAGLIPFPKVPDPEMVQAIVFEQIRRLRAGREAVRAEALRETMIKDLRLRLFAQRRDQSLPAGMSAQSPSLRERLPFRLPRRLRGAGRPHETVYRKHKIFLLKRTILPFLALLLFTALAIFGLTTMPGPFIGLQCLLWVLPVVSLFWLWFQYENWHNDEYILTDTHIIDVEATPLRLSEKRRQAEWERVQNADYRIEGLIANILNYGTVVIQTAAAAGEFDFVNVGNPRKVQREIFQRLADHRRQQDQRQVRQQQTDFRNALRTYDDLMHEEEWPGRIGL